MGPADSARWKPISDSFALYSERAPAGTLTVALACWDGRARKGSSMAMSAASSVAESLSMTDSEHHYPSMIMLHNQPRWCRCFLRCSPRWCWQGGLRASDLADLDRQQRAAEWSNVFGVDSMSISALSAPSDVSSHPAAPSIRPIAHSPTDFGWDRDYQERMARARQANDAGPLGLASDTQQMEMSTRI